MNKKWYLLTGASSGIGFATAKHLLHKGEYNLILVARSTNKLNDFLKNYNTESFTINLDLNELHDIKRIFQSVSDKHIKLSGFVHCAGIAPLMKVQELDIEIVSRTFNVNYLSFLIIMKYFSLEKYSYDLSRIIAISSIAAKRKGRRQSIYASSKAALENSVLYLANELEERKFSINGLALCAVKTEMFTELCKSSNNLYENILARQPLGILTVEVVAKYISELLCDEIHGYTTGIIYELNGGNLF